MSVRTTAEGRQVSKLDVMRPTPYLRKNWEIFRAGPSWSSQKVIDLGCGGGRNSEFLKAMGFEDIISLDWSGDYGQMWQASDRIPAEDRSARIIISNYFLMFLEEAVLEKVLKEITRVAGSSCFLMVELYNAKTSYYPTAEECEQLLCKIMNSFKSWRRIHAGRVRFILQKGPEEV